MSSMVGHEQWFQVGVQNGWLGPVFCYVHDSVPLNDAELAVLEDEGEGDMDVLCIPVVRLLGGTDDE